MDLKVSDEWHEQKLAAAALPSNSWESGGRYHYTAIGYKCLGKEEVTCTAK